jgi:hypothetical protein
MSLRLRWLWLLVLVLGLVSTAPTWSQDAPKIDPALVLARFPISKDGDWLLVPVTLDGKTYSFVVDTASTISMFDRSINLGPVRETSSAMTTGEPIEIPLHDWPDAFLGKSPLRCASRVGRMDLQKLREVSGCAVHGLLGMDVLSQYIVHICFERGELLLLKEAPPDAGQSYFLSFNTMKHPQVTLEMAGDAEDFVLDTGFMSHTDAAIRTELFDQMLERGILTLHGTTQAESAAGTRTTRLARGKQLTLGQFTFAAPMYKEGRTNYFSLYFLSHFTVTLDFPRARMYLRSGKHFARRAQVDRGGLRFLRLNGKVVVDQVDRDSAAEKAGLQKGDVLLTIGGHKTEESLHRLHGLLCEEQIVEVTFQRGSEERRVELRLQGE